MIIEKENKGFSLLEVLIAVSIIAVVFIAFIRLNVFSLLSIDRSTTLTKLVFLTKQRISEVEVSNFPDVGSKTGVFENAPGFKWKENVSEFGIDGVRKIEISVIAPDGQNNSLNFYKAR